MISYGKAFRFPFSDIKRLGIGVGIASISSVLTLIGKLAFKGQSLAFETFSLIAGLFAGLILGGYLIKSASSLLKDKWVLPGWSGFGDIMVSGLHSYFAWLIYGMPTLIVSGILLLRSSFFIDFLARFAQQGQPSIPPGIGGAYGMLMMLIGLALILFLGYAFPMILVSIAKKGFRGMFRLNDISGVIFTRDYLLASLAIFGYFVVGSFFINFVPVFGPGIVAFVSGTTSFALYSQVYNKKLGKKKK